MAERLKDMFAEDVPGRIAQMVSMVDPSFDNVSFIADALEGFAPLELTGRARHIAAALAVHLPDDREEALDILVRSLGPPYESEDLDGMGSFIYMPHVYFVAEHGLGCFEASMRAQYELTKRFAAEFSIRAFLEHHTAATLARLADWTGDPNPHVRRLVSEGTRPRLPWAPRLRGFVADPTPVIQLLDELRCDPSLYVRRSVANNLNDISKDHPELAVSTARRWLADDPPVDRFVVSHGLRTLVKRGDPGALDALGFSYGSPATVTVTCTPAEIEIGGRVSIVVDVSNPTVDDLGVLVDLRVHFVKADGTTAPRVFRGGSFALAPGEGTTFKKSVSMAVHTTRTPYPGRHRVEVLVNGEVRDGCRFVVAGRAVNPQPPGEIRGGI